MTSYLLTNVGLSMLVLTGLLLLRTAPPRPKMWICLAAVVAWCVPWPALSAIWESNELFVQYVRIDGLQTLPNTAADFAPLAPVVSVPLESVIIGAAVFGLLIFMVRLVAHRTRQTAMHKESKVVPDAWRRVGLANQTVPVRVVNDLDNALVSGFFRPRIWIGRSQLENPALGSILQHELLHIRQHDNFVLLVITLLTDIFWWNPLVRVLTSQARRYVELSCDLACQKLSSEYRENLAGEILNREYRALNSILVNPISKSRSFNVYRIRQLAKETVMTSRHFVFLGVLGIACVLFAANVAVSEVAADERPIATQLAVTTITSSEDSEKNTRSLNTEFVGEPEVEKLLELAKTADVRLSVHMDGEFRRVISIESEDMAETRKVLAAFENTGLDHILNSRVIRDTGRHIYLDLGFQVTGSKPYDVNLAPNIGEWTDVTVGSYLLRVRPDLVGDLGQETVLLSTEISEVVSEATYNLIATPAVQTEFGHEAVIQFGTTGAPGSKVVSLTMLPRHTL